MHISMEYSIVAATSYVIIGLFGSLSNSLVAITYLKWRAKLLTQPKDVLILSLSVGDLLLASVACPLGLASVVTQKWPSGYGGCVFYGFLSTWIGLSTIVQHSLLAIERLVTLSSPTPNIITVKRAFQMVTAAWVVSFISSCFPLIGWSEYKFQGFGLFCSTPWDSGALTHRSYAFFLIAAYFLLPVGAMSFSYVKIFFIVRRVYLNADTMWGHDALATRESYHAQVKTAKQLLLMIAGFMFAWAPYAIVASVAVFFLIKVPNDYKVYPPLFAKTSVLYNPIIYFFTYRSLRKKAIDLLRCRT